MEALIRNLRQRYNRAKNEMEKWDEIQNKILALFSNASSIINRIQDLGESKNYGVLTNVPEIMETVVGRQIESLQIYFHMMTETLNEFQSIVKSLEKISRDANQLIKSGSSPNTKQMQLCIGIWPSLQYCLDGLKSLSEMHKDEFALKYAVVNSLTSKCSSGEIDDLQRLLRDQPNIPKDEVQSIFDMIFADEISL